MQDLLGALLQSGPSTSTRQRVEHAVGERGLGQPGGLLGQLFGGASGGTQGGAGGVLGNLANMAQSVLGDSSRAVKSGHPAAIGGLGALAGALLGGGSGSVKGAVGGGALALLGSLALDAFKNMQQPAPGAETAYRSSGQYSSAELPLSLQDPAGPAGEKELESLATLVLKAMINAAKADGRIDEAELQRIGGKLQDAGADTDAQDFVRHEMRQPADLDGLVRAVPNPQVAAEVYAASLLAIEVDTQAERAYLQRLAQGLRLDEQVVQRLHTVLGVA
jgi:uncharacterized membrane protein YebE (DUF533 family)